MIENRIEIKVYSFDVFDKKYYIATQPHNIKYIQEYISSINSGNPDKLGVIRKIEIDHQGMRRDGLISELNQVEFDLNPIIESIKRDKKINNILNE